MRLASGNGVVLILTSDIFPYPCRVGSSDCEHLTREFRPNIEALWPLIKFFSHTVNSKMLRAVQKPLQIFRLGCGARLLVDAVGSWARTSV